MDRLNKNATKDKILITAARMFSERGYDKVTTREIAKAIGINSASIYHHFSSKDEILKSLYKYYSEQIKKERPDLNYLLRIAETEPPHDVLMKSEFHFDEDVRGMLDQILVTAARMIVPDAESECFIRENIFDSIKNTLEPLLERMIELGKIKPFDIKTFLGILSYYCFSAAALNNSIFNQSVAEYQSAMAYLFSVIVPV
jgi:AcrR family transcriptional regulator